MVMAVYLVWGLKARRITVRPLMVKDATSPGSLAQAFFGMVAGVPAVLVSAVA